MKDFGILPGHAGSSVHDKYGDIRLVQYLTRLLDSEGAEFSFIVKTWSIDHNYRSEGKKLHGF
jgi:hypothetical protein